MRAKDQLWVASPLTDNNCDLIDHKATQGGLEWPNSHIHRLRYGDRLRKQWELVNTAQKLQASTGYPLFYLSF